MFLIDDLLLLPVRGALWAARKVSEAAEQAMAEDESRLIAELESLHRDLEEGRIDEPAFEAREADLLDRLDRMRGEDPDGDDADRDEESGGSRTAPPLYGHVHEDVPQGGERV